MLNFDVSVTQPCSEDWGAMRGDARSRYCDVCAKPVVDLTRLKASEVELLAMRADAGESLCGRVTRRTDGSLVMLAAATSRPGKSVRGVVMSAALAAGIPAAAQMTRGEGPAATAVSADGTTEQPAAPVAEPGGAVIYGKLLRPDGGHVDSGLIYMGGYWYVADDRGRFEIHAKPGVYDFAMQTGEGQVERVGSVTLHEGVQSFGELRTRAGQTGLMEESYATAGAMVMTVRWSWEARLRHPLLYARSVVRRMR